MSEAVVGARATDRRRVLLAATATGLGVALAHLVFTLLYRDLRGGYGWLVPSDVWNLVRQARYVGAGALGYVYEAGGAHSALPLFPIVLAPVVLLGDGLGLSVGYPRAIPAPAMWPLVAAFGCLLAPIVGAAAAGFATRERLWWTAMSSALLVVLPAHAFGHFEEPLALAFLLFAVRAHGSENNDRSALLLSLAIATKQWTALALPLLVFTIGGARHRIRFSLISLALPVLLGSFTYLVDPESTGQVLLRSPAFPGAPYGHPLLWLPQWDGVIDGGPYRMAAMTIALLLGGIAAKRVRAPQELVATLAVVLLARAVLEPVLHAYYAGPAILLAVLHGALAENRRWPARVLFPGFALLAWCRLRPNPWLWWFVSYGLLLVAFTPAMREVWQLLTRRRHELEVGT